MKIENGDNKMLELHASFELDRSLYSRTKAQNMYKEWSETNFKKIVNGDNTIL
jgi:hypothetical protein